MKLRLLGGFLISALFFLNQISPAIASTDYSYGQRIDSRYCTIQFDAGVEVSKVNRKVSTRWIDSRIKVPKDTGPESELAAKCDILFRRAQEVLDMYPPGMHVTIRVTRDSSFVGRVHEAHYGRGTEAIAIYLFQENTIYASAKDISESVLIHEMAHSIIDHFFQARPPRKIEEMLAMYVDAHMRD